MVPVAQRRVALIRYTNEICYDLTNAPQVQDTCASFLSRKGNSMDEYDDKQHDRAEIPEASTGKTHGSPLSIEPFALESVDTMVTRPGNGYGNGIVVSSHPSAPGSKNDILTLARPATTSQNFVVHRVRINRILMR